MVSAIITTHNRSNLLDRAINSVLSQSYIDLELVVVSDGSTDDTDELMKKYASNTRVRYISYHPGHGGNYARNLGIKNANGEYVAFLDDDDEWMPDKIEKQLKKINEDPDIVLVYTGVHIIYVNEQIEYSSIPRTCGDLSKRLLIDNIVGSTSTPLIRKSVLDKSGFFDEHLAALQDYDLWIRISLYGKIQVVPEELIKYYNYTNSKQVSAVTDKYVKAFELINSKYADRLKSLTLKERMLREYSQYFLLGNKAMRNHNSRESRTYFRKAIRTRPNPKAMLYWFLTFFSFKTVLKLRSFI